MPLKRCAKQGHYGWGGGVSNIDAFYIVGVAEVRKFVFSDSLETPIVKNQLGDSAGVIGAGLIGI